MDSGLIQILVIGFFVIISMMDGAARKKRQEAQRQEAQRQGEIGEGEGGTELGEGSSVTTELVPDGRMSEGRTSEGMVPHELWKEIATLARGGPPPSTRRPSIRVRDPETSPVHGDPAGFELTVSASAPDPEESTLRPEHQHVENHDHVEWDPEESDPEESDPEEWDPEESDPEEDAAYAMVRAPDDFPLARAEERAATRSAPPLPERASLRGVSKPSEALPEVDPHAQDDPTRRRRRKATNVVRTLISGGGSSLRHAVILAEVLGPPTALQGFGHEPPG